MEKRKEDSLMIVTTANPSRKELLINSDGVY